MKNQIATLIILAAVSAVASAQSLVFNNQTITVEPHQLSVESVEFQPLEIVTNTVFQWVEVTEVSTNEQHAGLGDYVVETNTVSQQVASESITTNAATWICNVRFDLPAGHQWQLNGFPVSIRRFSVMLAVPIDPATVTTAFGPAAAGLEYAAQNGAYQPTGQVKDAFLGMAAAVLAGGAE